MVEQTYASISRVDIDRLYVDDTTPPSWRHLEKRTLELLENGVISEQQSRVLISILRTLEKQGIPVPADSGDLYLLARPLLESLPGGYG